MTEAPRQPPQRILVAISGSQEFHVTIDAAVTLAAGFGTALQCLIVEHEDLMAIAGLPFARTFGRGGMSSAVTLEGVTGYFRRLAQSVEHELGERCTRVNVRWTLARPHGDYVRELMASVEQGDVVVVSRGDASADPDALLAMFNTILEKAAAVVIPVARPPKGGRVLALSGGTMDGKARALAHDIALATGRQLTVVPPTEFLSAGRHAAIVVAPIAFAEVMGSARFLHSIEAMGAAAVLV